MTDRLAVARRAAERGAAVAMDRLDRDLTVATKASPMDLVTEADLAAQEAIVATIRERFPDDAVVGEEGEELKRVPPAGDAWVIDPIDGTTNFVHGLDTWGPAVAAVRDGDPVAATVALPAHGDTYVAGRTGGVEVNGSPVSVSDTADVGSYLVAPILRYTDTPADRDRFADLTDAVIGACGDLRRLGSAQATLAFVAAGVLDATVGPFSPTAWDTVAGAHLIERAGGTVTDLAGDEWSPDADGIVASNGHAHDRLLEIIPDRD
jgi:myo-inositol-1(or 4)-monophosphatase